MSAIPEALIELVFTLVTTALKFILYPIDAFVVSVMPDLGSSTAFIVDFLNLCFKSIGWCLDALGISSTLINYVILYYVFKYSLMFGIWNIKNVVKWVKSFI